MKVGFKRGVGGVLLTSALFLSWVTPVAAQTPPELPHAFYGTLTSGGSPAPAGTTVTAKVDGVIAGILVTTEAGKFGAAGGMGEKLIVQGVSLGGHTIEFYLSNAAGEVKADKTYIFQSTAVTNLNLTSPALPAAPVAGPVTPPITPVSPTAPELETGTTVDIVNVVKDLPPPVIVPVLEKVSDSKLGDILGGLLPTTAGSFVNVMATEKVVSTVSVMPPAAAGKVLEQTEPQKASDIMEGVSTTVMTGLISNMTWTAMQQVLPLMTTEQLLRIPEGTLFGLLKDAPVDQLVKEMPPQPPAGMDKPVVLFEDANGARYVAVLSADNDWITLMATPAPIKTLNIKTAVALKDIETTFERTASPPEASKLGAGVKAFSFFNLGVKNVKPEQILASHMSFYVDKKWINDNNINRWAIFLSRYDASAGKWVRMTTIKKEEDDKYVYYNATVTEFSLFAITGSETITSEEFTASNLSIAPNNVKVGEKAVVSADMTNDLGVTDKYAASVWLGYTVEGTKYLTLAKGQSTRVSFDITVNKAGTYTVRIGRQTGTLTVTEKAPPVPVVPKAVFEVGQLSVTPARVRAGQDVNVSVTVSNKGDAEGTFEAILKINGARETSKTVTLAAGRSTTVAFVVNRTAAATYQVEIESLRGQFIVEAAPAPARFEVSQVSATPARVGPGESVTISAVVANTGETEGTYEVVLLVSGAREAARSVTLGAGQSTTVTFTVTRTAAASYQVEIAGQSTQFTVIKPPVKGIPWWVWLIVGVVVVGVVVFFIRRRRMAY